MSNAVLAGHWVAKRDGYNCAEIVNYDQFVTTGCFTVHGNHVKVMKADRDEFGRFTDQVKYCPAVYYKVVDNC
jgi:cbb3-type cytochrome oxidase cytochrome c subunit